MALDSNPSATAVFAIDIGATNIKYVMLTEDGDVTEKGHRRPTPYPCPPDKLVATLAELIAQSGATRVGVGFPGDFRAGVVLRPGNLSRPGGVTTAIDPDLEHQWIDFGLQAALREASGRDVRVVNDATLAALGCQTGHGREVVMTLGTGCGLSLFIDGTMRRVRDVGLATLRDGFTYDECLGEQGRQRGEDSWHHDVKLAIEGFVAEFDADTVHLAGGNARRLHRDFFRSVPCQLIFNSNEVSLRGAARLFSSTPEALAET